MSNSAPISRARAQLANEDVKSSPRPRRNNSTRNRPAKSAIKVFQDAVQTTPSKDAGSVRTRKVLQASNTNTLPRTPLNEGKVGKNGVEKKTESSDLATPEKVQEKPATSDDNAAPVKPVIDNQNPRDLHPCP
ncbi:hypothetical protein NCC49_004292 [Naganishia albida]|nr:hypothetical protein NCC49_004292 [Naganishia albida]